MVELFQVCGKRPQATRKLETAVYLSHCITSALFKYFLSCSTLYKLIIISFFRSLTSLGLYQVSSKQVIALSVYSIFYSTLITACVTVLIFLLPPTDNRNERDESSKE